MRPDFEKYTDGLVPAIIQDADTGKVLMLGFMNEEAYTKTLEESKVVFYSRSKKRLWMKGEQSGNVLLVKQVLLDCDSDTLLVKAEPAGPVCHTGAETCFHEDRAQQGFVYKLDTVVEARRNDGTAKSYTRTLFAAGLDRIAQKVGEEAVELVIASKGDDATRIKDEAADLLFHYLVLLREKGLSFKEIEAVLYDRHQKNK